MRRQQRSDRGSAWQAVSPLRRPLMEPDENRECEERSPDAKRQENRNPKGNRIADSLDRRAVAPPDASDPPAPCRKQQAKRSEGTGQQHYPVIVRHRVPAIVRPAARRREAAGPF